MDSLAGFFASYVDATPAAIVGIQMLLLATAVGTIGAALVVRSTPIGSRATGSIRRVCRVAQLLASVSPMVGLLGTVLGAQRLVPAITAGDLSSSGDALALALSTTAIGIAGALPAIVAAWLLAERVRNFNPGLESEHGP